jgi:hypothetical protein
MVAGAASAVPRMVSIVCCGGSSKALSPGARISFIIDYCQDNFLCKRINVMSFAVFPLIIFLAGSPDYSLRRPGNGLLILAVKE